MWRQKRRRTGARRLAWGYLHPVGRHGKPNFGVLAEWLATGQQNDEDLATPLQLYAYQPDDVASRWQRPVFGLGPSPENVFHEEPHSQGSVIEAYAQYRYDEGISENYVACDDGLTAVFVSFGAQEAKACTGGCNPSHPDVCAVRRRLSGRRAQLAPGRQRG